MDDGVNIFSRFGDVVCGLAGGAVSICGTQQTRPMENKGTRGTVVASIAEVSAADGR